MAELKHQVRREMRSRSRSRKLLGDEVEELAELVDNEKSGSGVHLSELVGD